MDIPFGKKLEFGNKTRLQQVKEAGPSLDRLPKRGSYTVSIHKLIEDPENERRIFRNMEGLIDSVRRNGIVEPLTVEPAGGLFRIVTGHRRFRAAKAAGLAEIEIIVRDPADALTRRRKSIVSNVQREDIGAIEMAEALRFLLDHDGGIGSQRQLASIIGKSEQWVSGILSLLGLPASMQEKLRTPEVSIAYDSAMKIAACQDPQLQRELLEAALAGESSKSIRRLIISNREPGAGQGRPGGAGAIRPAGPMLSFYESCEGYTARVYGPEGRDAKRHMRAALQKLLDQLRHS